MLVGSVWLISEARCIKSFKCTIKKKKRNFEQGHLNCMSSETPYSARRQRILPVIIYPSPLSSSSFFMPI